MVSSLDKIGEGQTTRGFSTLVKNLLGIGNGTVAIGRELSPAVLRAPEVQYRPTSASKAGVWLTEIYSSR